MKRYVLLSAFLASVSAFALSEHEFAPGLTGEFSLARPFAIRSVWVLNPNAYLGASLSVDFDVDLSMPTRRPYRVIVPMTSVGSIENLPTRLCVRNSRWPIWSGRDFVIVKDNDDDPTSYSGSGTVDGAAWSVRMWTSVDDWRFHVDMTWGSDGRYDIHDDYPFGTTPIDMNGRGFYSLWAYHSNGTKCQHFDPGTEDYVTVQKKIGTAYKQQSHKVRALSMDFGTAEYDVADFVSVLVPSGAVLKVTKTDANAIVRMIYDDASCMSGDTPPGGGSSGGHGSSADPGLPREIY